MFQDFEKASKDVKTNKQGSAQGANNQDPFAALLGSLGGADGNGELDDQQMMNMFKGLLGSLGEAEGGSNSKDPNMPSDDQMKKIMEEFSSFMMDNSQNPEFNGALNQVVKEMISKDSMYEPMKKLKEAYPDWLENNWQKLSDEDLERYNKQLDKVTEICVAFEQQGEGEPSEDQKTAIFEKLNELQELGHPPDELMTKVHGMQNPNELFEGVLGSQAKESKPQPAKKDDVKLNNPFEKME